MSSWDNVAKELELLAKAMERIKLAMESIIKWKL